MSKQPKILDELIKIIEDAHIPIWFYGGYALDALEGKTIRIHGDIDFFVHKQDQERLKIVLISSGFSMEEKSPQAVFFSKEDESLECLTFEKLADGMYVTDTGETGIYPWPDNSFPDEPNAVLIGKPVRVISYEAQYVFKAGYQGYDPSKPLRDKDIEDLNIICQHVPIELRAELALFFDPLPNTRKCYPK